MLISFHRFPAKFILYVCHLSFIRSFASRETRYGSCSCSCWCDSWLAILNLGISPRDIVFFIQKIQTSICCWSCHICFSSCKSFELLEFFFQIYKIYGSVCNQFGKLQFMLCFNAHVYFSRRCLFFLTTTTMESGPHLC